MNTFDGPNTILYNKNILILQFETMKIWIFDIKGMLCYKFSGKRKRVLPL